LAAGLVNNAKELCEKNSAKDFKTRRHQKIPAAASTISIGALLLDRRENLLLIFYDGVQSGLIFQNGGLVLFDGVLVGLDLVLIGDNFLLVFENLFLIGDDVAL
jgi:hypothetical protein